MEVLNGKEKLLFYLMILKSFKEMVTNYDTDPDKKHKFEYQSTT